MEINITCGQYANDYYSKEYEGIYLPFNEAMNTGNILYPLFYDDFINERVKTHHTTKEEYLNNLKEMIDLRNYLNQVDIINCYFGDDDFCKVNVYYLFKYLIQENYKNKVILNIIDENTYIIKNTVYIDCLKTYLETCSL